MKMNKNITIREVLLADGNHVSLMAKTMICAGWLAVAASTPADIVWSGEQNLSGQAQYIDLNSDSLVDVLLEYAESSNASLFPTTYRGFLNASIDGYGVDGSNRILIDPSSELDAPLPFGTLISGTPDSTYEWKSGLYESGFVSQWSIPADTEWRGLLGENGNTYIGIEFEIEGSIHYAWVNIALGEEGPQGFEMPVTTSWAYESTPNSAIIAGAIPEPSTGILTVGGSLSLLFLARSRRRGRSWRICSRLSSFCSF
jgi:hypothetical protein